MAWLNAKCKKPSILLLVSFKAQRLLIGRYLHWRERWERFPLELKGILDFTKMIALHRACAYEI